MIYKGFDYSYIGEPISKEHLREIEQRFIFEADLVRKTYDRYSSYSSLFLLGKIQDGYVNTFRETAACAGGLCVKNKLGTYTDFTVVATNPYHRNIESKEEWRQTYIDWLINESFVSPFILNKDNPDFCRDYGVIITHKVPRILYLSLLQASRAICEVFYMRGTFNPLPLYVEYVKKGLNKDLLFYVFFNTTFINSSTNVTDKVPPLSFYGKSSGHVTISDSSIEDLKAFLNNSFSFPMSHLLDEKNWICNKPPTNWEMPNKYNWTHDKRLRYTTDFILNKSLYKYFGPSKKLSKSSVPDPFQPASSNKHEITLQQFLDIYLEPLNALLTKEM